jgi:dephospho-CoA kinase
VVVKGHRRALINKRGVAEIVFSDPEKRKALEGLIHPEVFKKMNAIRRATYRKKPEAVIVFEVPLLFETGCEGMFDKVVVVHCTKERAIKRLMEKGLSRGDILKRMGVQMPITKKKKKADFLIDNNGSLTSTMVQVRQIMKAVTTV